MPLAREFYASLNLHLGNLLGAEKLGSENSLKYVAIHY